MIHRRRLLGSADGRGIVLSGSYRSLLAEDDGEHLERHHIQYLGGCQAIFSRAGRKERRDRSHDPHHNTRIDRLTRAVENLSKQFILSLEDHPAA